MPHPWRFHGWAAANSPCRFIGHSEIAAFVFIASMADKTTPLHGAPSTSRKIKGRANITGAPFET
jgi:hypothetical protein